MQRPGHDLSATAQRPDPPILRSTLFHGTWNTALASRGIPHQWSPSAPIRHCIGEQGKSTHSGGPAAPIRDGRDQSSISDRKCHEHRVESSYQSRQGDSYHPIRDTPPRLTNLCEEPLQSSHSHEPQLPHFVTRSKQDSSAHSGGVRQQSYRLLHPKGVQSAHCHLDASHAYPFSSPALCRRARNHRRPRTDAKSPTIRSRHDDQVLKPLELTNPSQGVTGCGDPARRCFRRVHMALRCTPPSTQCPGQGNTRPCNRKSCGSRATAPPERSPRSVRPNRTPNTTKPRRPNTGPATPKSHSPTAQGMTTNHPNPQRPSGAAGSRRKTDHVLFAAEAATNEQTLPFRGVPPSPAELGAPFHFFPGQRQRTTKRNHAGPTLGRQSPSEGPAEPSRTRRSFFTFLRSKAKGRKKKRTKLVLHRTAQSLRKGPRRPKPAPAPPMTVSPPRVTVLHHLNCSRFEMTKPLAALRNGALSFERRKLPELGSQLCQGGTLLPWCLPPGSFSGHSAFQ